MRTAQMLAMVLMAAAGSGCSDSPTTARSADEHTQIASADVSTPPLPIAVEMLTSRHEFTDDIAVQVRVGPRGRPTDVVNLRDASNMAVLRFTVQPGVRFPWHSHPGLVMVTVTQGELIFVYADDCVERRYPAGTAFVDPGFGNVHYARNPTGGETVLVATFLGLPASGAVTIPVDAAESTTLDAKCAVPAALAAQHSH